MMYNARSEIPNLKTGKYWSSTDYGSIYYNWYYYVDFSSGSSDYIGASYNFYVRAVRTVN